jgi:hypothetical protein
MFLAGHPENERLADTKKERFPNQSPLSPFDAPVNLIEAD